MIRVLILGLLVLASTTAEAHQSQLINAWVRIKDRTVTVAYAFKGVDMTRAIQAPLMIEGEDQVDAAKLIEHGTAVAGYVTARTAVVQGDGHRCVPTAKGLRPDRDGLIILVDWLCLRIDQGLTYRSVLLLDIIPSTRQLLHFGDQQEAMEQTLLDREVTEVALLDPPPPLAVAYRYVLAGIEHIFIGTDHIAFLIGVLLWARRLMPLVKIVTAFTLAHTITLSLAVLDIVSIPSWLVELMIALTIVYVGAENFFSRNVDRRWRLTLGLGLIHGFGFASVLRDFGLPSEAVALPLAAFNIGVELGQLAIVVPAILILITIDHLLAKVRRGAVERNAATVYLLSGLIMAYGLYLVADRALAL